MSQAGDGIARAWPRIGTMRSIALLAAFSGCIAPPLASVAPGTTSAATATDAESRVAPAYVVDPQMPVDFCEQRADHWWTLADGTPVF